MGVRGQVALPVSLHLRRLRLEVELLVVTDRELVLSLAQGLESALAPELALFLLEVGLRAAPQSRQHPELPSRPSLEEDEQEGVGLADQ